MSTKNETITISIEKPAPKKQVAQTRLLKGTKKEQPPALCKPGSYL